MKGSIAFLMCGSFNPVTRPHLRMLNHGRLFLEQKYPQCKVVKAIISPVNDLYHVKRKNLISSYHRIEMIRLAIEEESANWIECDAWESKQKEWQRTLNVLNYQIIKLKKSFDGEINLWILSGGDLIESMGVPGLWKDEDLEEIFSNYKALIFPRMGSNPLEFIERHEILKKHRDNIVFAKTWEPNNDSSTKARNAIAQEKYPRDLLHDSVIAYIKEKTLFKD